MLRAVENARLAGAAVPTPKALAVACARGAHLDMMRAVCKAAWRATVLDVETTLLAATDKLLRDASVDGETRRRRARALRALGAAFTQAAARAGKGCEIPNFKGSYLGRFPLVLADFWTSDHLSERSRT